jgi:signal transduction histidine kinase
MLLVVIVTVVFMAMTIQFSVQRETEKAMLAAHDENALHLMNAVALHVESQYRSILFHESATLERRKTELRNIVTIALHSIERCHKQQEEGQLTEAEAQRMAFDEIREMRYDDGVGYFWINDTGKPSPRMLMHPTEPELVGSLMDEPHYFSAMGTNKHALAAFADVAVEHGEGYVDYTARKPTEDGLTEQLPKISYVRLFEPWGWVIGTGVYIDDIEAEAQKRFDAVLTDLTRAFSKIRIAETGYLFIFDTDGETLVHPYIARGSVIDNSEMRAALLTRFIEAAKTPSAPIEYVWDRPGHRDEYRFRKRAYVTHFEPLDWYIGASFYTEEMELPAKRLAQRTLLLSSLVLLAAVSFAVFVSKGLTKPLRELTLASTTIEHEGIHSAQIPISGTVETIELGSTLSKMVSSIRESEREREDLIAALEAQNAELERFAYSVSHDLKSPLITIRGYIGALSEDLTEGNTEAVIDDARRISNAADKMAALLNDVLELSRIGRVVNPPQDVPLGDLADEALELVTAQIEQRNIQVEISPNLPIVYGDRGRLLEVLQNLIDNAIKYVGDQPQPRIEIGSRRDDNGTVCYVRDNGIGIEPRYHEKIFRLFDQLDQSVEGTGIGLALVKRIVEVHGGRVWVESEGLGQGARFCFTIAAEGNSYQSGSIEDGASERQRHRSS